MFDGLGNLSELGKSGKFVGRRTPKNANKFTIRNSSTSRFEYNVKTNPFSRSLKNLNEFRFRDFSGARSRYTRSCVKLDFPKCLIFI